MPPPRAVISHHGVSPWELEAAHDCLCERFEVSREEGPHREGYATVLGVSMEAWFGDPFFEWFGRRRWERLKFLLREMKRRRGGRNAIEVSLAFSGSPSVRFVLDAQDRQWYNNAVERVDFVTELLPYHLDPARLPAGADGVTYGYDERSGRWAVRGAAAGGAEYRLEGGSWSRARPPS